MLDVLICHRFSDFTLDVRFQSPERSVTALFGPSGCGKSTIVNAVAGLLRPDAGCISIGGTVMFDAASGTWIPPERRGLGVVFQEPRLFPHLTVRGNLDYGLRRSGGRGRGITVHDVVALLGLRELLAREVRALSGGESQRVAIGRALLAQPRLLVMDEPLSSLDSPRKAEILPYLTRLKSETGLPILYVTHALDEVAQLADRVVLLNRGGMVASGALNSILTSSDLPLATREDAAAILDMTVAAHDASRRLTRLVHSSLELWVPMTSDAVGALLRVRVPAREVILAATRPDAISLHNIVPSTVRAVAHDEAKSAVTVELAIGAATLLARVTPDAVGRLGIEPGSPALALIKSMSIDVLAR